jgi:tetratricopeptide (TPR) repeat protein
MTIERIIGIDFGNTDTVVAYRDSIDGIASESIHYLQEAKSKQRMIPSRVMMKDQKVWCGGDATDENTLSGLKAMLVDLETQPSAKFAIVEFFKYLYRLYTEQSQSVGKSPDKEQTILAVPDEWDHETSQFLVDAVREAGFPAVSILNESIAVLGGWLVRQGSHLLELATPHADGSLWFLLIDSGGLKTDVTLHHYLPQENGRVEQFVLHPQEVKNHFFGGDQIDAALVGFLTDQIKSMTGNAVNTAAFQKEYGREIESWKRKDLCPRLNERWSVSNCPVLEEYAQKTGIAHLKFLGLDRRSFRQALYYFGQSFIHLINECLDHAVDSVQGFPSTDLIDFVILSGGNSQWYLLRDILTAYMPDFGVVHLKQFQASYARILAEDEPKLAVVDGATLLTAFPAGMLDEIRVVAGSPQKRTLRITGNPENDEQNLREIIAETPQDVEALNQLGSLLAAAKRYAEAESSFKQAQQANPQVVATYVNLGNLLCSQNHFNKAEAVYRDGLSHNKKNGELSFHLAEVLLALNRNEKAVKAFQQAVNAGYCADSLYLDWAKAWRNLKNTNEAVSVLQQGIERIPTNIESYLELADLFLAEKQNTGAESILSQALEVAPEDERVLTLLGTVHEVNGKTEEAILTYEKVLRIAPENSRVQAALGRLYLTQGSFAQSEKFIRAALKIHPTADLAYELCTLFKASGRKEQMVDHLKEAVEQYPQDARFVVLHAELLEEKKQYDEAVQEYQCALQIDARNLSALNRLGNLLDDLGQSTEAIECFRQSIQIDPTNATAYKNLAYLLECQEEFAEAEDTYWKAIQYDPEDLSSYHYLGEMLETQGRHDEAEAVFKVARRKEDLKIELAK